MTTLIFTYGLITFALLMLATYVRANSGWLIAPRSVWAWVVAAILAWPVALPVLLCVGAYLGARKAWAR